MHTCRFNTRSTSALLIFATSKSSLRRFCSWEPHWQRLLIFFASFKTTCCFFAFVHLYNTALDVRPTSRIYPYVMWFFYMSISFSSWPDSKGTNFRRDCRGFYLWCGTQPPMHQAANGPAREHTCFLQLDKLQTDLSLHHASIVIIINY